MSATNEAVRDDIAAPGAEPLPEPASPAPVDARGVAITVMAVATAILLAQYMQSVLIPFVLAGLVFYALDPLVDRLQRLRVPRSLGAGLMLALLVTAFGGIAYTLSDDALRVVELLPEAADKVRAEWTRNVKHEPTALDKVQEAARAIDQTAAAAAANTAATPRGVTRVQIEAPPFRASDYLISSSMGMVGLLGQGALVLLLTFFLLVYDDLFKRKLVENIGPTLGRKRITVQILNDIASQIEGYLMVQVFTFCIRIAGVGRWSRASQPPARLLLSPTSSLPPRREPRTARCEARSCLRDRRTRTGAATRRA